MINPAVFKPYDIRGIYPADLDEEGARRIARAFVHVIQGTRIAVGRDTRLSSPQMAVAAMQGAASAGAEILDLGIVGSEVLYFAVTDLHLDGGIEITASHNPKNYTGMKLVHRDAIPIGLDSGLLDIRDRAVSDAERAVGSSREIIPLDVWPAYIERVLSLVDVRGLRPLRVVLDAGNGAAGQMLPRILEHLPVIAQRRFFTPDGNFPHHEPNPVLPENRRSLEQAVVESGADLGVAFDGDADRCIFVDNAGTYVPPDFASALFIDSKLKTMVGARMLYEVRSSWAVREGIARIGAVGVLTRVGHAFFKRRMRESSAVYGSESSGHYYFRDFVKADSSMVAFLWMLELLSRDAGSLSALLAPLRDRYFLLEEMNVDSDDPEGTFRTIEAQFGGQGEVFGFEGISIESSDWHLSARASNTEPLLRVNLEARSRELLESKKRELLDLLDVRLG